MMNDLPKRSQFESRLPEEKVYWEKLAVRITDSAEPILRERRDADAWWQPLAKWSPVIGVAAAVAALLVVLSGPPSSTQPEDISLQQILSPDDPISRALVGGEEIGNLSTMLLWESGGGQ
jgi:anti-sigma-K factor RskA